MSWLTQSDIEARLRVSNIMDLADDDGDNSPDTNVINAVIADAESEVESRLAGRYAVPFTSSDNVLVGIASALAIHRLYLRKNSDSPIHVKESYDAAQMLLDRIANGEAALPGTSAISTLAKGTHSLDDRAFTREALEDL